MEADKKELTKTIPFEEIFVQFVHMAQQKLSEVKEAELDILKDNALYALQRSLLEQLSLIYTKVMELEFSVFRAGKQSAIDRLFIQVDDKYCAGIYKDFVKNMQKGGLTLLLKEYPVLSQLLSDEVSMWIDNIGELLERLKCDLSEIAVVFNGGQDVGKVAEIRTGLSDRHCSGRTVISLWFESGLKLVYKPRNMGMEDAYFRFLYWLNGRIPIDFKLLKVINRQSYGWMEFAEYLPCEEAAAGQRYYRRAGMLLAVVYLLGGKDCHCQNVIASGEYPLIIDLETLVQPRLKEIGSFGPAQGPDPKKADSVLGTGLLPGRFYSRKGENAYDICGFGTLMDTGANNMPFIQEKALPPHDYADEIVSGFDWMYRFFLEFKEEMLAHGNILECFKGQQARFVFRSTAFYRSVLLKTLKPKYMRDNVMRRSEIDILCRSALSAGQESEFWKLIENECKALERVDIPYFTVCSEGSFLNTTEGKADEEYFAEGGFDGVIGRLNSFTEQGLKVQRNFITDSFINLLC